MVKSVGKYIFTDAKLTGEKFDTTMQKINQKLSEDTD